MKYEISQAQYAAFLSTLTSTQVSNRYSSSNYNSYRNMITGTTGNYSSSLEDVACNYLTWMDGCAYADWAGLRPMTELEYEKACRGTSSPVAGEYAWGTLPWQHQPTRWKTGTRPRRGSWPTTARMNRSGIVFTRQLIPGGRCG